MSTQPQVPVMEKIAKVFKATLPSVNYIFRNGKPAIFINSRFATAIQTEIDELEAEIAAGHPHLFIDEAEKTIDAKLIQPMEALREKLRAEIMAEMAKAVDPTNDMGTSEQGPLKPANSQDIATAAEGGSGVGLAARLVTLKTTS